MAKLSTQDILDAIKEMNMLEVSDLVQSLEKEFNITAAAPVVAAVQGQPAGGESTEAAEEKTTFDIVLTDAGSQKIAVIKAIREILPDLGLAEAKAVVDAAPKTIKEGASKDDAASAKEKLEKAGAKVELK